MSKKSGEFKSYKKLIEHLANARECLQKIREEAMSGGDEEAARLASNLSLELCGFTDDVEIIRFKSDYDE